MTETSATKPPQLRAARARKQSIIKFVILFVTLAFLFVPLLAMLIFTLRHPLSGRWSAAPWIAIFTGNGESLGADLTVLWQGIGTSLALSAVTVVIMLVLVWFTGKTKMGKAMRACSEDKAAAQLMGINVNRTISMTFAIGSALAAIAGVLLCSYSPVLQPTTGSMPGIKAFTAAVFGGIGSIPGAFVGGILLGIIEAMAQAYISTSLANSIVFGVLIVVLLVKPAGLFGKYVPEKV